MEASPSLLGEREEDVTSMLGEYSLKYNFNDVSSESVTSIYLPSYCV